MSSDISFISMQLEKIPKRLWNFYIEALLVPSYRTEWGKYKDWSYKSPPRPPTSNYLIKEKLRLYRNQLKPKKLETDDSQEVEQQPSVPSTQPHNHADCERIRINVGGCIYETQVRTLSRYPDTLLGDPQKRVKFYDPVKNEYYFDRNRASFEIILYYYQSGGRFRRPGDSISADVLLEDAKFYQLSPATILQYQVDEGFSYAAEAEPIDELFPDKLFRRKMWLLFDYPESSHQAEIVASMSISTIVVSITIFCLETLEDFSGHRAYAIDSTGSVTTREFDLLDISDPFFFTESVCSVWFLIEYLARFLSSPIKTKFLKSFLNAIDLIAIVPYFFTLTAHLARKFNSGGRVSASRNPTTTFAFLRVMRLVRVFRVLKLSRHSKGLKILGKTLHASLNELILLIFFVIMGVILFSSAIYFAEQDHSGTKYRSIPDGFWWAVITLTTVGFGDIVPKTTAGKIVGALCAVAGVLTIALPVPVIVSNFNFFYHQAVDIHDLSWIKINHVSSCPFRPNTGCNCVVARTSGKKKRKSRQVPEFSSDEDFGKLKKYNT